MTVDKSDRRYEPINFMEILFYENENKIEKKINILCGFYRFPVEFCHFMEMKLIFSEQENKQKQQKKKNRHTRKIPS